MAKAIAKTAKKTSAPAASKSKPKTASTEKIEKINTEALKKLQALGIEQQLQSDIEWCLGSYRHDKNPAGLYEMGAKALTVFKAELAKKTKGVTAKLISDLEAALKKD